MRRSVPLLALLAVLLAGSLALGPVAASPQPAPVCSVCGLAFEGSASDRGVDASVTESTAVVAVRENGTATWTIRNELAAGADEFRDDPRSLHRAVRDTSYGFVPDDAELASAEVEDDTVVLTYEEEGTVERRAGLLVYDGLEHDGWKPYYLNVDELVVRGPDGSAVTNDPEGGEVDGAEATWRGNGSADALHRAPRFDERPLVVFGTDDAGTGVITEIRTTAALGLSVLPQVVSNLQRFFLVQTLVFTGVLAAPVLVLRKEVPLTEVYPVAGLLAVGGLLGVTVGVPVAGEILLPPSLLVLLTGLLGLAPRARTILDAPYRLALAGAGLLAAVFAVQGAIYASPVHTLFPSHRVDAPIRRALDGTAVVVPLAAMLPLGGAVPGDRRRLLGWWVLAGASFAFLPLVMVTVTEPVTGTFSGLAVLFLFVPAVLAPLVGAPVLALGRALTTSGRSDG